MEGSLEKRVVLLISSELKPRPQYKNPGLKLTFKDVQSLETYQRTLNISKAYGPTVIRCFMKVVLGEQQNHDHLLKNHKDLVQAFKDNDDKFFEVDIADSPKNLKSNGEPYKNILAISNHKPTFDEKMDYLAKDIADIDGLDKSVADLGLNNIKGID